MAALSRLWSFLSMMYINWSLSRSEHKKHDDVLFCHFFAAPFPAAGFGGLLTFGGAGGSGGSSSLTGAHLSTIAVSSAICFSSRVIFSSCALFSALYRVTDFIQLSALIISVAASSPVKTSPKRSLQASNKHSSHMQTALLPGPDVRAIWKGVLFVHMVNAA